MTPIARLWAAIQTQPKPSRVVRDSWHVAGVRHLMAYDAVLDAAPRPIRVYRRCDGQWGALCRICGVVIEEHMATHAEALESALWELHEGHGCPSRRITGEACHTTCIHCHGWQWCATPTERSDW